mmetsp:Transcript_5026/g.7462  ORF Transcript_5026/g.7462 Transcript_5026/m.7462 type:complete len:163 (+) Transcript_5026:19-507(+)
MRGGSKFTNMVKNGMKSGKAQYYIIDAKGQVPGRISTTVTQILQGKHKPTYNPERWHEGDNVIIVNAKHIRQTGTKWSRKLYRYHSGYLGGLKEITTGDMHEKDPTFIIRRTIQRQLPKGRKRKAAMNKLYVYPEETHNMKSEKPIEIDMEIEKKIPFMKQL